MAVNLHLCCAHAAAHSCRCPDPVSGSIRIHPSCLALCLPCLEVLLSEAGQMLACTQAWLVKRLELFVTLQGPPGLKPPALKQNKHVTSVDDIG